MLRNRTSSFLEGKPSKQATLIGAPGAAAIVGRAMDAVVNDEMVEKWFSANKGSLAELSEHDLSDIAPWFPIIGFPVNDRFIGIVGSPTL